VWVMPVTGAAAGQHGPGQHGPGQLLPGQHGVGQHAAGPSGDMGSTGLRGRGKASKLPPGDFPETLQPLMIGMWHTDERTAWRVARSSNRGLVIDFRAEWCLPCMLLEHRTFADPEVKQRLVESFVPLRIDVTEETMAGRKQLDRFRIVSLPAVVILDANGNEIDRINRYVDASVFLARLDTARARSRNDKHKHATRGKAAAVPSGD